MRRILTIGGLAAALAIAALLIAHSDAYAQQRGPGYEYITVIFGGQRPIIFTGSEKIEVNSPTGRPAASRTIDQQHHGQYRFARSTHTDDTTAVLNVLGGDGWEVITYEITNDFTIVVMKRPL